MPRLVLLGPLLAAAFLIGSACAGGDDGASEPASPPSGAEESVSPPTTVAPAPESAEPSAAAQPEAVTSAGAEDAGAPQAAAPQGETSAYTVEPGDTLLGIALSHDTTVAALLELNRLSDADVLDVGQVLQIPLAPAGPETEDADGAAEGESGDAAQSDEGESDAAAGSETADTEGAQPHAPQEDSVVAEIPPRPDALADYAAAALPWLHTRDTVAQIVPLFETWEMPSVRVGDRLNLVDTDADGRSSAVIVYTQFIADEPLAGGNLVIYDQLPDRPDRYRIAYDHRQRRGGGVFNVGVLDVVDLTGDGRPDITFIEQIAGAQTITTIVHLLVSEGGLYRDLAGETITIPNAVLRPLQDRTGDGLADIAIEGSTAAAEAGPPRSSLFVFSAAGGALRLVQEQRLASDWLVWRLVDANEAFDAAGYAAAITLYQEAATDPTLREWGLEHEREELVALARLRSAIAYARLDRAADAIGEAQTAATGSGLVAALANAFLGGYASTTDLAAGCAGLNGALITAVADFDAFWDGFGDGLPPFPADRICPF